MKTRLALLMLLFSFFLQAQEEEFKEHVSNFNMTSFTYKHNNKWSGYLELQQRSIQDFSLPDYYEVKGGIGYNFNKSNQIFVGTGRYGTYRESKFYQREYRMWLQYVFSHNVGRLKMDHRARLEKRFFYFPQEDKNTNDERYRYRLSLTMPLNNEKMQPGTFFANTFEEIFFGPRDPNFKRNRYFAGFGYQFSENINTNLGYMWQKEFSVDDSQNFHFVYFALNFTFDRLKDGESLGFPVVD